MAHYVADRVRETSTTTGTGTLTLAGAVAGFRSMAAALPVNNDTGYFFATDGVDWEVFLGTRASSTTLTRTTILASSNAGAAVNWGSTTKDICGDIPAYAAYTIPIFAGNYMLIGGKMVTSIGSNALTLAVKTNNGNDPSVSEPVFYVVRSGTATDGSYVVRAITGPLSLTISAGSTMGTANNVAFRLVAAVFDDGGTARLGLKNAVATGIDESILTSGVAEGGAGAADSADTWYTSVTVTTRAFSPIGFVDYPSGVASAGTWTAPTTLQGMRDGVRIQPPPFVTVLTTGSGTYTVNAGVKALEVEMVGGGGGGGGGAGGGTGGTGGNSTFGSLTANGGVGGTNTDGGAGGAASGGDANITGGGGQGGINNINATANSSGGQGGSSAFGGGGKTSYNAAGTAAGTNSGGGGGGGGTNATGTLISGGGGGGGGYVYKIFGLPAASYSYGVGAAGTAGTAGAQGFAGGAGAAGVIRVTAYF